MADETSSMDMKTILFTQLVLTFQASAMQQMGKVMNPFTQKIERNLSQAQMSIDMLAMLQEKTHGNLSPEESRLIERALFELRLNYVDEVEKDKKKAEEEKDKGEKKEVEEKKSEKQEKKDEEKGPEVDEEVKAEETEVGKKEKEKKREKKPSAKTRKSKD